jgi:hypothetical protein
MLCEDWSFQEIGKTARESLKEERKLKNKPPKWVNEQMAILSITTKEVFVFFDRIKFYEFPRKLLTTSGNISLIGEFNNCVVAAGEDEIYTLSKNSIKNNKNINIDTAGVSKLLAS